MACIELGLAKMPGAVERPWAMALERPQEEKPLPPDTKIEDVFRQLGGAMLILGAPGSGKTVTLLTLAHQLLDRAERDPTTSFTGKMASPTLPFAAAQATTSGWRSHCT